MYFNTGCLCEDSQTNNLTMAATDLQQVFDNQQNKNATKHYKIRTYCLKYYLSHLEYHRSQYRLLWNPKIVYK